MTAPTLAEGRETSPTVGAKAQSETPPRAGRFRLLWWLVADALWSRRGSVLASLVAAPVAVVAQGAAFSLVVVYARALEASGPIVIAGQTLPADGRLAAAIAIAAALLLLTSGVLSYVASTISIGLRRQYGETCRSRALSLISRLPHPASPQASLALLTRPGRRDFRTEARLCGRLLVVTLAAVEPTLLVIFYGVALAVISPTLALAIAPLAAALFLVHLQITHRTAAATREFDEETSRAGRELRALSGLARTSAAPMPAERLGHPPGGAAERRDGAFFARILARSTSRLASSVLAAITIPIVVVLLSGPSREIILGEVWTASALLVGTWLLLQNFRRLGAAAATAARLSPALADYHRFVMDAERAPASIAPETSDPADHPIRVRADELPSGMDETGLATGSILLLLHHEPDRTAAAVLFAAAREAESDATIFVVPSPIPGVSLRAAFGLGGLADDELQRELATLGFSAAPAVSLDALGQDVRRPMWYRVGLVAAVRSRRPVILFPTQGHRIVAAALDGGQLRDRVLVIVAKPNRVGWPPRRLIDLVLASDGARLIGWCSGERFREDPDARKAIMSAARSERSLADDEDGEDDDEDARGLDGDDELDDED